MAFLAKTDREKLLEARQLALRFHRDQTYGGDPYEVHLDHVVEVLRRFGVADLDMLAAGYLHDAIEDTPATKSIIELFTNTRIAQLVDAVSDGPGTTRTERKERPYALIPTVRGAIELKLADRISNLELAHARDSSFIRMYRKEHGEFEKQLLRSNPDPRVAKLWTYCRLLVGR